MRTATTPMTSVSQRPVGLRGQPELHGARQLRSVQPEGELDVVPGVRVHLGQIGDLPIAQARQGRQRLFQRGLRLVQSAESHAPAGGQRLERQAPGALHARHALVAPIPAVAQQLSLRREIHRDAPLQRLFHGTGEMDARREVQAQHPVGPLQPQGQQFNGGCRGPRRQRRARAHPRP